MWGEVKLLCVGGSEVVMYGGMWMDKIIEDWDFMFFTFWGGCRFTTLEKESRQAGTKVG